MRNKPSGTGTHADFIRFLGKHIVCLEWVAREGAQDIGSEYANYTGFVISIRDTWFLLTAGHNLRNIEEAISHGIGGSWFLDDTGGGGTHETHIPFDYSNTKKFWFDEAGADYALLYLEPYRSLLEANQIVALDERAWKQDFPVAFDHILLLGIPEESLSIKGKMLYKGYALSFLELTEDVPSELQQPFPRLYAKVSKSKNLNDIKGMSGGPIFGLQLREGEEIRYWVIALQSGWLSSARVIAACPVAVFCDWVDRELFKVDPP